MNNLSDLLEKIEQLSPDNQAELAKYVEFLQWQETQANLVDTPGWSFSFIEAFKEAATSATEDSGGMDVQMATAIVGRASRPALWAHPPVTGKAVIEYYVPVPQQVTDVNLKLAIGIRDGAQVSDNNLVAFGVRVNGIRVWGKQSNEQSWQSYSIPLNITAGDMVRFEFTTEALGNHQWTWAVWGNPELTGKTN